MLTEFLQDRAALYVSGDLDSPDREQFELILEFHEELRTFTAGLGEVGAVLMRQLAARDGEMPSPALKTRVLSSIAARPQQTTHEALVVSNPDGRVHWVNQAFSAMCGYSIEELRGKKLGPILQGADTDRATVERIRAAVHSLRPCRETILNYHKNGTPYWVEIDIAPIVDDAGTALWLVAREREQSSPMAA